MKKQVQKFGEFINESDEMELPGSMGSMGPDAIKVVVRDDRFTGQHRAEIRDRFNLEVRRDEEYSTNNKELYTLEGTEEDIKNFLMYRYCIVISE
jgi:hypothetical protein